MLASVDRFLKASETIPGLCQVCREGVAVKFCRKVMEEKKKEKRNRTTRPSCEVGRQEPASGRNAVPGMMGRGLAQPSSANGLAALRPSRITVVLHTPLESEPLHHSTSRVGAQLLEGCGRVITGNERVWPTQPPIMTPNPAVS